MNVGVSDGSDGVGGNNIYIVVKKKNQYQSYFQSCILNLKQSSVSVSRLSSYSTSYYLLTISTTNCCFEKNVNNFGLRKLFYSKQNFKNTCCSFPYTNYKRTNSTELIIEKCIEYVHTRQYIPKVLVGFNIIRTAKLLLPDQYTQSLVNFLDKDNTIFSQEW